MMVMEGGGEGMVVNGGGDSSEEELAVLPRHTKVVVTGNNRTKSVLVGLQGVVKKAVGLGGWHWLVLTNGIEVKLQRNALSVLEAPTGEEEDDYEMENIQSSELASDDNLKPPRSRYRSHKVTGLNHKSSSRSQSCDSHSKRSVSPAKRHNKRSISPVRRRTMVDLSKLSFDSLWKYRRHFNLETSSPNPSKEQLVDVVERHFVSQQLDEVQVFVEFVRAAKRLRRHATD